MELRESGCPDTYDIEKQINLHFSECLSMEATIPSLFNIAINSVDPLLASTASARRMWNGKEHSLFVMNNITDSKYALRRRFKRELYIFFKAAALLPRSFTDL